MFTIETETGFTIATDTADEFDHALHQLNSMRDCFIPPTAPLEIKFVQPEPCTCDADRPAPPPIPDGSINPTETPFMERCLGDSDRDHKRDAESYLSTRYNPAASYPHVANQQNRGPDHSSFTSNLHWGSGNQQASQQPSQQVDPEEMLANTIEQRDHIKADREVMYLRERLANANGTIEGLRANLREQATQLGRVMEEREKAQYLHRAIVALATQHGWSPDSSTGPVEQISEWLDIFVRTENERKALREQLARAAEINLGLEDKLAVLAYKRKGKGKVQIGD